MPGRGTDAGGVQRAAAEAAERELAACNAAPRFAREVAAGRPYPTRGGAGGDRGDRGGRAGVGRGGRGAGGTPAHRRAGGGRLGGGGVLAPRAVRGRPRPATAYGRRWPTATARTSGGSGTCSSSGRPAADRSEILAEMTRRLGNDAGRRADRGDRAARRDHPAAGGGDGGRMSISTHVLDATTGRPAVGVAVRLSDLEGAPLVEGHTDSDGRCAIAPYDLDAGHVRADLRHRRLLRRADLLPVGDGDVHRSATAAPTTTSRCCSRRTPTPPTAGARGVGGRRSRRGQRAPAARRAGRPGRPETSDAGLEPIPAAELDVQAGAGERMTASTTK